MPEVVPMTTSDLLAYLSAAVAVMTVVLAMGGVFAFVSVRRIAMSEARKEANEVATGLAEAAAVSYLQEEIPAIIGEYMELARGAASDAIADRIAQKEGGLE